MKNHPQTSLDLTTDEQRRVRAALQFLRLRVGDWKNVARVLHLKQGTIAKMGHPNWWMLQGREGKTDASNEDVVCRFAWSQIEQLDLVGEVVGTQDEAAGIEGGIAKAEGASAAHRVERGIGEVVGRG